MWALLTSRLAGPIAFAMAVALACFLLAVSIQNAGLKSKVAKQDREINGYVDARGRKVPGLRDKLSTCQDNEKELEGAISRQNAAIRQAQAESAARSEAARDAVKIAEQASREAERRVGRILSARPGRDACESADRLILESLG